MSVPEWAKDEPSIEEAKNFLRQGSTVDFFELVASSLLREHPKDVLDFCIQLVDCIAENKEPPQVPLDHQPKHEKDGKYMRDMNISAFLDAWVLALLEERPASDAERLAFHKRYLAERKATQAKESATEGGTDGADTAVPPPPKEGGEEEKAEE